MINLCSDDDDDDNNEQEENIPQKVSAVVSSSAAATAAGALISSSSSSSSLITTTSLTSLQLSTRQRENELNQVNNEIEEIEEKMEGLRTRLHFLQAQRRQISDGLKSLKLQKNGALNSHNWASESFPHSTLARNVLKNVFKYDKYRSLQLHAINATLSQMDTFVVMPTGMGKSLIYQLPAVVEENKLSIVICPLLSLSKDQLMGLNAKNIPAAMLSSDQGRAINSQVMKDMKALKLRLVYVTPEKVSQSKAFMSALQKLDSENKLGRFVIDEAHCCSTMGHDFRPDYQKLHVIRNRFPKVPILAVTATATSAVERDVCNVLFGRRGQESALRFRTSFNRPNLVYEVHTKNGTQKGQATAIGDIIMERFAGQCGIVYCGTKKETEDTALVLSEMGLSTGCYHAGLTPTEKAVAHEQWSNYELHTRTGLQVICATTAFGMGIDKPNVRFVIHRTMPKNMSSYCQESGRAGRDAQLSHCILFYRRADVMSVSKLVSRSPNSDTIMLDIIRYCENVHECRRKIMSDAFSEPFNKNSMCGGKCDICVAELNGTLDAVVDQDVTSEAKAMLKTLTSKVRLGGKMGNVSLNQLVSMYRRENKTSLSVAECERICINLLALKVFSFRWVDSSYSTNAYLVPGTNSIRRPIVVKSVSNDDNKKTKKRESSSNKQVKTNKKRKKQQIVLVTVDGDSDDGDEDDQSDFERSANSKREKKPETILVASTPAPRKAPPREVASSVELTQPTYSTSQGAKKAKKKTVEGVKKPNFTLYESDLSDEGQDQNNEHDKPNFGLINSDSDGASNLARKTNPINDAAEQTWNDPVDSDEEREADLLHFPQQQLQQPFQPQRRNNQPADDIDSDEEREADLVFSNAIPSRKDEEVTNGPALGNEEEAKFTDTGGEKEKENTTKGKGKKKKKKAKKTKSKVCFDLVSSGDDDDASSSSSEEVNFTSDSDFV